MEKIIAGLGEEICLALPDLHAFTGNDYTSAFHRMGKVKALNILKGSQEYIKIFKEIGTNFTFNNERLNVIEKFVCELYGIKNCTSTNKARYKKFCSSKKILEPQQLPPTSNALLCHMKRVNYVTAVVKASIFNCNPIIPCPDGYGWIIKDDVLNIVWMLNKPVPEEIIELISCSCCKSSCKTDQCVCKAHSLNCTDLCNCTLCENGDENIIVENESSDEEEKEDE